MIVLSSTTDLVTVVLGGAHVTSALRCYASWRDITTTTYSPGRTVTDTNGTTPVNLVPSPASSTQRVADYMSVFNSDTVAHTVTVTYSDNGTGYTLWSDSLAAGERLEYTDAKGFQLFDINGIPKLTMVPSGASYITNSLNLVVLGSDVTNNNAVANTIADVTGLSFAVVSGQQYYFRFVINYTAAAATTGSRWSINGPGSPTLLSYWSYVSLAAAAGTDGVTTAISTAYDTPAASNASSANTGGNIAVIEGFIQPSSNGTVIARFASEVASSAIVAKAGSICMWYRVV